MKKYLNILITGGAGFIGSHVADTFSSSGHNVLIFDIKASPYIKPVQKFISGDVLDSVSLEKAMQDIDVVFHFAALADIDVAENRPYDTMNINIMGTVNVLEAARKAGVKYWNMVYLTSSMPDRIEAIYQKMGYVKTEVTYSKVL